ncbi:MAG TPA: CAP domain-containing protein [Solirubrobacteraceae bacterium]|jgi:uncharacterized protein YkwD|nr:CAP domain-containing protein [Solirubrobacteraceae bacterium]
MLSRSARPRSRAQLTGLILAAAAATAATAALPASPALAAGHHAPARSTHHSRRLVRSGSTSAACADANLVPTPTNRARIATATLCLINQQRAAADLAPLRSDAALGAAAAQHSADMVANDYFDHVSPSGSTPKSRLTAVGYIKPNHAWTIGENIAAATGSLATPASIVKMWMNSPGHRANILNAAFRDTGIAAAAAAPALVGAGPGGTYTEDFGARS